MDNLFLGNPLANKVALVTGGSGGIGSAICERLAEEGANVVVHYSGHADSANEVVSKIKNNGSDAIAIQANLSQSDEVTRLFETLVRNAVGLQDIPFKQVVVTCNVSFKAHFYDLRRIY